MNEGQEYEFRVAAVNDSGAGEFGTPSEFVFARDPKSRSFYTSKSIALQYNTEPSIHHLVQIPHEHLATHDSIVQTPYPYLTHSTLHNQQLFCTSYGLQDLATHMTPYSRPHTYGLVIMHLLNC